MTEIQGVVPALAQALNERGYTKLTPVQDAVVASGLGEADALVSAQTGSGKTVAFGIALGPTLLGEADRFTSSGAPLALIVAPTRELALQIKRELDWLYQHTGAVIASCVGGMDMRTERQALARGSHIVVGTPGRLRDHLQRNSLETSRLKAVVLDEADEMLDLGFREDLEFILEATPEERRTLLFSATVPDTIGRLARKYQRDAVRIETSGEAKQHLDISYRALNVASGEKENAIINVLRFYEAKNALVFCNTRAGVNHMTARLNNRGFSVVALSGELSQGERTQALQSMRDGRARVCIATDVAARGIDLPNLELVIHADLPNNPDTLLHRSGRTGRAGRKGVSAMIVLPSGRQRTERLLYAAKIQAEWGSPPSADAVIRKDDERLLADAAPDEAVRPDEQDIIAKLMAQQSAEQIATAFVRLYRAGKSSPEELAVVPPSQPGERRPVRERKPRKEHQRGFTKSVWFSLSVGRKQNAEPRWLIPMLCKAGGITNREIGAIKMHGEETHVELNANCAEQFQAALGPNRKLEKNVTATRLDGTPTGPVAAPRPRPSVTPVKRDKPRMKVAKPSKRDEPKARNEKPAPHKPVKPAEPVQQPVASEQIGPKVPNRKERRLAKFGPAKQGTLSEGTTPVKPKPATTKKPKPAASVKPFRNMSSGDESTEMSAAANATLKRKPKAAD